MSASIAAEANGSSLLVAGEQHQADGELGATTAGPMLSSLQTVPPNQMDSIVNVTREFPLSYAIIMFGYLLPVVLVVSIVTNCLVVAVLYQRHMRTPTNIVLLMMAIVDLATLLSPSPWYLYIYTLGNHDKFLYPPAACYAHHLMTDVVPVFFHTSSIWLALLLASQRYIYVCHPTLARTWCTVPRVKRAICTILAVAFLHQLSRFFDNTFIAVSVEVNGVHHMACRNEIAPWVHNLNVPRYYTTYFTFRILFVFIFPCTALITLNWLLFRALKRAETKRTMLLKTKFKIVGVDPTQTAAERVSSPNLFASRGRTPSYVTHGTCKTGPDAGDSQQLQQQQRRRQREAAPGAAPAATHKDNLSDGRARDGASATDSAGFVTSRCAASNLVESSTEQRNIAHLPFLVSSKAGEFLSVVDQQVQGDSGPTKGQFERAAVPSRAGDQRLDRRKSAASRTSGLNSSVSTDNQSRASASSGRSSDTQSDSRSSSPSSHSSATTAQTTKTDDGGDDDPSTCAECAAELRRSCRRCSLATNTNTNTSAACEHHKASYQQHRRLLHQPISQCSSILGGATNTTNEEDNSSCLVTQNMSSSMFVPAVAALDAIETSSMRCSDEEEEEQVHELPVDCELEIDHATLDGGAAPARGNDKPSQFAQRLPNSRTNPELGQMIKSGSVDSRLACACLSSGPMAIKHICSVGKPRQEPMDPTRDRLSHHAATCQGGQSCWTPDGWPASVRRAEPASDCYETDDSKMQAARGQIRGSVSLLLGRADESHALQSEPNSDRIGAQLDGKQRESGQTITFQPTTTTTTTIISANTSSVGSLVPVPGECEQQRGAKANLADSDTDLASSSKQNALQVDGQCDRFDGQLKMEARSGLSRDKTQRIESQSFSCRATGRRSRGALFGLHNPASNSDAVGAIPIIVSNNQQSSNTQAALHPVTTRSMDSNRTTLMLVVVVSVFLFVEVPVALMTIAHVILNTFDVFKDFEFNNYLNYIKLITNFMIMISYSVNFTIYCSMSKRFRETFRDLFYCGRSSHRRRSKRIFSQSQAVHCPQFSAHPLGPASTMMTSMLNQNNQNNQLTLGPAGSSKKLREFTPATSIGNQNLITSGQSLATRINNHYECEL